MYTPIISKNASLNLLAELTNIVTAVTEEGWTVLGFTGGYCGEEGEQILELKISDPDRMFAHVEIYFEYGIRIWDAYMCDPFGGYHLDDSLAGATDCKIETLKRLLSNLNNK